MGHTPEPWRAEWQPGQTPKHTYTHCVMYGDDSLCDTLTQADAERIVACVNACTGMADPAGEIARLMAERDRYEKALKEIESHHATQNDRAGRPQEQSRTLAIVRAALSAKEAE